MTPKLTSTVVRVALPALVASQHVQAGRKSAPGARPAAADSPLQSAARAFVRRRAGVLGLSATVLFIAIALLAPILAPYDALVMDYGALLQSPSLAHIMGTDEFGRDILSRILVGSRVSLSVGFISIGMALLVGVPLGLMAGYLGGWFDNLTMRFFDVLLAFPAVLLAIVIMAMLGPSSLNAMLAVAIVNVPAFARLTRASVLSEKCLDYVEAARAIGARTTRVMFCTILPNVVSTILVQTTIAIAAAVLLESSLSFLGLGAPPPAPSWGSMLSTGRGFLAKAPWYGVFPGLAMTALVLGLYLLGDGLRDALDPRRQG